MKDDKVASEDEDTMTWTDVPAAKREGQLPPSIEDSRPQELDAKITDDEAAEPGAGLAPSSGFAAAFVVARWADERGEGQLPPSIEDSRPQELDARVTDDEAAVPGAGLAPSSGTAAAFVVARWADERGLAAAERPEEFYRYF